MIYSFLRVYAVYDRASCSIALSDGRLTRRSYRNDGKTCCSGVRPSKTFISSATTVISTFAAVDTSYYGFGFLFFIFFFSKSIIFLIVLGGNDYVVADVVMKNAVERCYARREDVVAAAKTTDDGS